MLLRVTCFFSKHVPIQLLTVSQCQQAPLPFLLSYLVIWAQKPPSMAWPRICVMPFLILKWGNNLQLWYDLTNPMASVPFDLLVGYESFAVDELGNWSHQQLAGTGEHLSVLCEWPDWQLWGDEEVFCLIGSTSITKKTNVTEITSTIDNVLNETISLVYRFMNKHISRFIHWTEISSAAVSKKNSFRCTRWHL